jgi:hypothetical protein
MVTVIAIQCALVAMHNIQDYIREPKTSCQYPPGSRQDRVVDRYRSAQKGRRPNQKNRFYTPLLPLYAFPYTITSTGSEIGMPRKQDNLRGL